MRCCESQKFPVRFGHLIHLIRETDDGCEMRSRFWLGNVSIEGLAASGIVNRMANSRFVAKQASSLEMGRDLIVHCGMEMNHLASFLPDLYAEYN